MNIFVPSQQVRTTCLAHPSFSDQNISGVRSSVRCLNVIRFSHCQLILQNHCMPRHQSYHKCSSRGPETFQYLFEAVLKKYCYFSVVRYPTWGERLLIGWDILNPPHPPKKIFHMIWPSWSEMFLWGYWRCNNTYWNILNPRWLSSFLIGLDMFYFFSKQTAS